MKTKHNICVIIHDESHLQEAIELLSKYNEKFKALDCFTYNKVTCRYLQISHENNWYLTPMKWNNAIVNLSDLEVILMNDNFKPIMS